MAGQVGASPRYEPQSQATHWSTRGHPEVALAEQPLREQQEAPLGPFGQKEWRPGQGGW